jgi:sugar O-acyltransferase (sialic acid O-acetyltransferase NeuD family)
MTDPEPCPGQPGAADLYLVGTGSFAVEVAEWATDAGWRLAGLIELLDDARIGTTREGLPVLAAEAVPDGAPVAIALGGDRAKHWPAALELCVPARIVHPKAHVAPSATLGPGCIVAPGVVIGAATSVGAHALVSRGALVGHHARIGDFASLLPGVNVGGHTSIGTRATLGMGAVVVNGTLVGEQAVVAAGAVVLREVGPGKRVQGVPARDYTP